MKTLSKADLLTASTLFMILGFTLPSWMGLLALTTQQWNGDAPIGRYFMATLFAQSPVWALLQTGLIALVAAPAALNMGDQLSLRSGVVTIALVACFVPLGILVLIFLDPTNSDILWSEAKAPFVESILGYADISQSVFMTRWNGYVTSQAQVLAAQIALFLGLRAKAST